MRFGTLSAAVAAAALFAAAGLTAIGISPAAAGGCATVHHDLDGITVKGGAKVELTDHGVKVTTRTFTDEGATWLTSLREPAKLGDVDAMSFRTIKHTDAQVPVAMPAYLVKLRLPAGGTATLVAEPYYDAARAAQTGTGKKVTWDVFGDGRFWTNGGATPNGMILEAGGSYAGNKSWADITAANPDAMVVSFGWQQSWAQGLSATITDVKFRTGGCTTHHKWKCDPKPTRPTTAPTTTTPTTTAPTTRPPTATPTTTRTTPPPPTTAYPEPSETTPPVIGGVGAGSGDSDGGALALTGAAASTIAGGATAMIAGGVLLLLLLRRRRATRFTA